MVRSVGVFSSWSAKAGGVEVEPSNGDRAAGPANAVTLRDVGCTLAGRTVLDGLSMNVPVAGVYALTGGNGAGKSVLLRLIAGRERPDHGTIEIFDLPPGAESAAETGFAPPPDLSGSGRDALTRIAGGGENGARGVAYALSRTGLADRADLPAATYTAGDLRRLTIAAALVTPRALVLLDDPFDGLDPGGVADVARLCRELSDDGVTVVLASRPHPALEDLATHIGMLSGGHLIAEGPAAAVRAATPTVVVVRTRDVILGMGVLRGLGLADLEAHRDHLTATLADDVPIDRVIQALVHGGVRVASVSPAPPPYAGG